MEGQPTYGNLIERCEGANHEAAGGESAEGTFSEAMISRRTLWCQKLEPDISDAEGPNSRTHTHAGCLNQD